MDYRQLAEKLIGHIGRLMSCPDTEAVDKYLRGEYGVLSHLFHVEEATPGELMDASGSSSAYIAKVLRGLEAKGEITRRADPNDRRRTLVQITETGRQRIETSWDVFLTGLGKTLQRLGEDDAQEFVRLMGKMADTVTDQA